MPQFSFEVTQGKFSNSAFEVVLEDSEAALREALAIVGNFARDIVGVMTSDSEWRVEVADDSKTPLFCIRLIVETPDPGGI